MLSFRALIVQLTVSVAGGLLFAVAVQAGIPEAAWPPLVRLPPAQKAPVIDGVITPGEWDGAFMGSGITSHKRGGLDPIQAQYWFTYDENRIYIAARMQTHPEEIFDRPARRLAGGGPSSHFEILVDPNPCHPDHSWVQAMMYPLGRYENLGYSQRIGGYIPYDIEWDYADSAADGWWTIEMSVPADAFHHAKIADGLSWGILYAGSIRSSREMYYFSGQLGELFRTRARYLKMIMDRTAPVVQVQSIGEISDGLVAPDILIRNTTGRELVMEAEFAVRESLEDGAAELHSARQSATVAIGAEGRFNWAAPLPEPGKFQYLFMTVKEGEKSLYEGVYKLAAPRSPIWGEVPRVVADPVIFETFLYPYFSRVRAIVDFGGLENTEQAYEARFTVTDAAGNQLAEGMDRRFDNNAGEVILQLPEKLVEGIYSARVELLDREGRVLAGQNDTFERKSFSFEHNQLGVSDKVLHPWTPIEVDADNRSISVWNRTYTLNSSGLPESIETQGRQVLAGPIALMEKLDGVYQPLQGRGVQFTAVADHEVRAVAHAAGRAVEAEISLLGEYDGMLKYELLLSGRKGAVIEGLELVMPLKEEHARLIHAAGDGCRTNYSQAVPAGTGTVWDSTSVVNWTMPTSWLTYLWLGDYERGLCWWADSAEGWTLPRDKHTPVVRLERRDGQLVAVMRIVDRPTPVLWRDEAPRRIVFAIEATPVRPRASWARDVGLIDASVTKQNHPRFRWWGNTYWTFFGQEKENDVASGRYTFAHLRPLNEEAEKELRRRTTQAHEEGHRFLVYTDMRVRSLSHDEARYYTWEWAPRTSDARKQTVAGSPAHSGHMISSTQSRIDYDLWCINLGMDLGIDYWYFDEIQNEGQINPAAGLGYQDEDGRWMPTGRLFQYRDFWKRLYTMMQERGQQEPVIVIHNTSTTYAGPMAFTTATYDFEEGNTSPDSRHLTMFGMDYLLAQTMGHQYGFVATTLGPSPNFEAWLKNYPEEERGAFRHWMGVHMILDMNPYLTGQSREAVVEGLKLLGEFGWNQSDCEWTPYWRADKEELYTVSPAPEKRIYSAIYRRPGKALLILLNDTGTEIELEWRPGPLLGVLAVSDAEAPETSFETDVAETYRVRIPHFNYRALMLETRVQ